MEKGGKEKVRDLGCVWLDGKNKRTRVELIVGWFELGFNKFLESIVRLRLGPKNELKILFKPDSNYRSQAQAQHDPIHINF